MRHAPLPAAFHATLVLEHTSIATAMDEPGAPSGPMAPEPTREVLATAEAPTPALPGTLLTPETHAPPHGKPPAQGPNIRPAPPAATPYSSAVAQHAAMLAMEAHLLPPAPAPAPASSAPPGPAISAAVPAAFSAPLPTPLAAGPPASLSTLPHEQHQHHQHQHQHQHQPTIRGAGSGKPPLAPPGDPGKSREAGAAGRGPSSGPLSLGSLPTAPPASTMFLAVAPAAAASAAAAATAAAVPSAAGNEAALPQAASTPSARLSEPGSRLQRLSNKLRLPRCAWAGSCSCLAWGRVLGMGSGEEKV
jgi:hypothetical protein